jgi:hypothetical protein
MMFQHRLTRTIAVAVTIAATAAPIASADPWAQDPRGLNGSIPAPQKQDLRNPDTRDFAEGRGTYNSPEVVVVESPAPVAQPTAGGIDWEDVGIGAGGLLGLALLGAGGALAVVHRRGVRQVAG